MLEKIEPESISLSVWSPPYHVGKDYERKQTYDQWIEMINTVVKHHYFILKPGGFLAINISDILCFQDPCMPRIQANNISGKKQKITTEDVQRIQAENPSFNRKKLAEILECSEQTIDRRLHGNNIRGGKKSCQTRVKVVGGTIEEIAHYAGLYVYDRRFWVKDPAWKSSKWTTNSYRAVDECEYIYFLWKPGVTQINKSRLTKEEWAEWGSRAVWKIPSVRENNDHPAKFPVELPRRVIRLLSDKEDIILDCFMGSGTTAIAAIMEGRNFIGIEKEKKFVQIARERVDAYRKGKVKP